MCSKQPICYKIVAENTAWNAFVEEYSCIMAEAQKIRQFSLLIKPVSADCNLACSYCFYLPKAGLYPGTLRHRMSKKTLERVISSYLSTGQPIYSFAWQGGEPTLMGVEFYRQVVELQSRHGSPGATVANALQTNATLITEEMARFFSAYRFLVGVSLDGPQELHDRYRRNRKGNGSYRRVLRGIELLMKHRVEVNVLVAVHAGNVDKPREVYRFLVGKGMSFHQYIPIVEFDERGDPLPFTILPEQWGAFLEGIYEQWLSDGGKVSVRLFDAILARLVGQEPVMCSMGRDCRQYVLVEYNGDIYPCDFFVRPELRLGNILDVDWQILLDSPRYRDFGLRKSLWNERCQVCPYLELCHGDCPKHRLYTDGDPSRLSWLCAGWKAFYDRSLSGFQRIARRIQRKRSRELEARLAASARSLSDTR